MKVHANAPLGPKGRLIMVLRVLERGWSLAEAAEAAGVSDRTCSKWVARYRVEGKAGLLDRSSAPKSIPHRTPDELVEAIVLLRRLRMTGAEIAFCLGMALSTIANMSPHGAIGDAATAGHDWANAIAGRSVGSTRSVLVTKRASLPA